MNDSANGCRPSVTGSASGCGNQTAAWRAFGLRGTSLVLVAALAVLPACGPRQVEVRSAPPPAQSPSAPQNSVQVTNSLNQAVNVYVTANGTDTFLRQVAANATVSIPVTTVATGTSVTLKAVTLDGVRTYTRQNVVLSGTYVFPVP